MKRAWAVSLLVVAGAGQAGQLITERYGLEDVKKQGGFVVAGTVESFQKGKTKSDFSLTVKVTRVFGGDGNGPAVGSSWKVTVYDGVEWTDPNRSPLERRLRNAVGPVVSKGKPVFLATEYPGGTQVELLEATPENQRRVEVRFDDAAKKAFLASPDAVLEGALGDDELVDLAFPELKRRGQVKAGALLKSEQKPAREYLASLAPAARAAFFKDALLLAKSDTAARDALFDLTLRDMRAAWAAEVAPLTELLTPAKGDEGRRFFDVRDELWYLLGRLKDKSDTGKPDFSGYGPYLARYLLARPDYRSDDEEVVQLFPFMNAASKQQLALTLMKDLGKSTRSKPDDPDTYLLYVAEVLARQAPSPALIAGLEALDPSTVRVTSVREEVMGSMLAIGLALVKGHPAAKRDVQAVVEPWLANGTDVTPEALKPWRAAVGAWKPGPAVAATFELVPGAFKRLSTGARARFTRDEQDFGFEFDAGSESRGMGLPFEGDWYRELYVKPWLVTVGRVGTEAKAKVVATAAPAKLEPMENPKANDVLKAQAEKDGCPQYEENDFNDSEGYFAYQASGPNGKKCSYVLGLFTRKVQRRVVTP